VGKRWGSERLPSVGNKKPAVTSEF
jgi:hypothetical protein